MAIEPIVSEHALLRWIKRVKGVGLRHPEAHILANGAREMIQFAKSKRLTKDDVVLIVKNNTVATVE